ncbi:asparaginase (plasmid) [Ilyobacter polytropus DSM 2926]|uniref:asparaginase n=1 Tax=Ilyobacter polytropus (strain ATCC 51220 / DSM 2926 / LMG 16218 / CuHBu1) TaxID=572544 RepID=E3HDU3_ILYPC|nr:asparaginase [Ilyobacter polytropus]ADO84279.1 asparaginase [Ilyobacter polytropus DSM 2926]
MLDKVLIINTGGTIGMVHSEKGNTMSPLRPAENWNEIAKEHPVLKGFATDYYQFHPLVDSSDINPESWTKMAQVIETNYNNYRGFVLLHGTDTMSYTASALSFMLKNLDKPVIITGAQVPLEKPRSDALQNLVTAIQIAGNEFYGIRLVPEVCIFFRDTLLRGNRSRKNDARNYFGFSSPNYPSLAEAGAELGIKKNKLLKKSKGTFHIETALDDRVIIIEIFPGLKPSYLKNIFESIGDLKGVILKTYGNGNAPTNVDFIDVINSLTSRGIVVINITQCTTGTVKMGMYEASIKLVDAGVVSGLDLTPEAALTKLMYLLGKTEDSEEVKKLMSIDICGEQTLNHYNFKFTQNSPAKICKFSFEIPKEIAGGDMIEAALRIKNLSLKNKIDKINIRISIEGDNFIENIEKFQSIKTLKKNKDNINEDILLNFNKCVKKIAEESRVIKITLESDESIVWGDAVFSIYSEC